LSEDELCQKATSTPSTTICSSITVLAEAACTRDRLASTSAGEVPLESSSKLRVMAVGSPAQVVELQDMLSPTQLTVDFSSSEGRKAVSCRGGVAPPSPCAGWPK
jgi:hypothetical protein